MTPEIVTTATATVVTFDGDQTLWDFRTALRQALELTATWITEAGLGRPGGAPVTADWLYHVREAVNTQEGYQGKQATMEDKRLKSFEDAAHEVGAPDGFAVALFDRFMDARHEGVRLYDDSRACLEALKAAGMRLGLVTNGNSKPELLGVSEMFDVRVMAGEVGLHKPDPAIYRYAADRLGVAPEACVHVGDNPRKDVEASMAAGMRAVWLDRATTGVPSPQAWRTVTTLGDVPALFAPSRDAA